MSRQWPFLIPFVAMAAGMALSAHYSAFVTSATLAAGLVCLILSAFYRDDRLFSLCSALFFFLWGWYALTPWLLPDTSPASLRQKTTDVAVVVEGIIAARPTIAPEGGQIIVTVDRLYRAGRPELVTGRLLLYVSEGDVSLARGDRIRCLTRITVPRRLGLPGEFDYPRFLALHDLTATGRVTSQAEIVLMRAAAERSLARSIDLTARRLGDAIRRAVPDARVSSVLTALLLGDQKRISQDLSDAYTRAGVNHILSISGFHVGIIAAFITVALLWGLTRFEYPALRWNVRRMALLLAVPSMLYYLLLTGNAPATARSVIMLIACAMALFVEREVDPVTTLLMAAFLLVAINPPTLFDISFQLSYISLWGIVTVVPMATKRLHAVPSATVRNLLQFVAASVAAAGVTLIPVLYTFRVASMNGVVTNFLIVPLLGYGAVLTGFTVLPLITLLPSCAPLLLWPAAQLVKLSNWFVERCTSLPVVRFDGVTALDMLLLLALMSSVTFIRSVRKRLVAATAVACAAVVLHLLPHTHDGRLHITMLSVGQAESILLQHPDGSTTLVDGGGYLHDTGHDFGQRVLAPALGALNVSRIDRMISTHDHPDHIGGLSFVARYFPVGEFWSTSATGSVGRTAELSRALADQHIPIRRVCAGDTIRLQDGCTFSVYSPTAPAAVPDNSDEMNVNEQSLVFRLSYGNFSMLFTADAGHAAERRLLGSGYNLNATVLKVGHHGSRYSTSAEFLGRVNPKLALISAGYGNRFGLPAAGTLQLLASHHITLYRTDRDGSIELVTDGRDWDVATPFSAF